MKVLITENQTDKVLQMLINKVLDDFRNVCDDDTDDVPDWFHGDECDFMDYVTKVEVVSSSFVESPLPEKKILSGLVNIYHTDRFEFDEEDFLYYITDTIRIKYKVRVYLEQNEQIF